MMLVTIVQLGIVGNQLFSEYQYPPAPDKHHEDKPPGPKPPHENFRLFATLALFSPTVPIIGQGVTYVLLARFLYTLDQRKQKQGLLFSIRQGADSFASKLSDDAQQETTTIATMAGRRQTSNPQSNSNARYNINHDDELEQ